MEDRRRDMARRGRGRDRAMNDRARRDRARGGRGRDREMEDMRMNDRARSGGSRGGRDGRNPYGSRGGYVRDRAGRQWSVRRDYDDYDYDDFDYEDFADYDDYDEEDFGGEMLSDRELMDWSKKLLKEVDKGFQDYFSLKNIEKKAKDMNVEFEDFSFEEFYTTVLMMFTDYHKTLGTSNMDIYLRIAKDWLCDEDAGVQYGEKLAAYYDNIVEAKQCLNTIITIHSALKKKIV